MKRIYKTELDGATKGCAPVYFETAGGSATVTWTHAKPGTVQRIVLNEEELLHLIKLGVEALGEE